MRLPASTSAALIVLFAIAISSCTVPEPIEFGEERRLVLESVANTVIVPGYDVLLQRCDVLVEAVESLSLQPTQSNLDSARSAWVSALLAWDRAQIFDFGPAVGSFGSLTTDIGTFPASEQKIESAIATSDTSTQDFDRDKRGFYAIEYLLFGSAAQQVVNPDSIGRRSYLMAITQHLQRNVQTVRAAWTDYRTVFISRSGTDAGSSMSLLFNALNMSYEQAKNYKVALPAGRITGQTTSAHRVEAYYSGLSIRALKAHINSVFELWRGAEPATFGFEYYLRVVPQGQRLIDDTKKQMDSVNVAVDAFNDNERLSDLILADDPRVNTLVEQTQKMTRFLKSELSSLIGIAITYSSGDGD